MFIDSGKYGVTVEDYAERHYIKVFQKKYHGAWDVTLKAIVQQSERIDQLTGLTDRAEIIRSNEQFSLVKMYFRVAGTNESAKGSGNRVVLFIDRDSKECKILLVYSKNEIGPPNETQKWESEVRKAYPQYWTLLSADG